MGKLQGKKRRKKKEKEREEWRRGNGHLSFPSDKRPGPDADHEETVSKNSHTCKTP